MATMAGCLTMPVPCCNRAHHSGRQSLRGAPLQRCTPSRSALTASRATVTCHARGDPEAEAATQDATKSIDLPSQTAAAVVLSKAGAVAGKAGSLGAAQRTATGGTPLGSGVQNATSRYALPSPTLAVRNLIEGAHYAHLCTNMSHMHHRRSGYPFGMLIDFAADGAGYPIFCLSPLSIHSHNLREDPRCSLVVQMPGWTGLSNARVTLFGDVYELPEELQEAAKEIFLTKHHTGKGDRVIADNHRFYRMVRVLDIYFVGGFGTVQWIDVSEYAATKPDAIALYHPHETINALTAQYGARVQSHFQSHSTGDGNGGDGAIETAFISIDATGADVRLRYQFETTVHRLSFERKVYTPEDATRAVAAALDK